METYAVDPTQGFISVPLKHSNFQVQRPYDVPQDQRDSFINGVHRLWVFNTDKPHSPHSHTKPRTEIRILGHDYSSGVWQFEGDAYVPQGTSGVCIMQVFGASPPHATTLMLRVYNPALTYYTKQPALVENIYDKWFRVNVIHDVDAGKMQIYINGVLKIEEPARGGHKHYFKFGVYAQNDESNFMESRWKNVKVLKKST